MEIDKNRIVVGSLILLFFLFAFFIKLDFLILTLVSLALIVELFKSKFINNISDFIVIILFITVILLIKNYYQIINYLNFFLVFLVIINILFPNFHLKKLFLISIVIFIINFYFISYIDRNLFYFTIFIAFFNDTIAYIFGRMLKGPLIIPHISPNKTWSGTSISFVFTLILISQFNFSVLLASVLSISLFIGDIFFSYIKRKIGLKDFSNFLQGHGGILDRLDSMFFFTIIVSTTLS